MRTRFNGRVNLLDLPALKAAVPQMNNQQLGFYLNMLTRNQIYNEQRQIVSDELAQRPVVTFSEYGRCR